MVGATSVGGLRSVSLGSRGSQAFLKLLVQDEKGRRRDAVHPTQMLTDGAPRLAAGGGGVSHPTSAFGFRSQKVFLRFFGGRRGHARNILALGEVAQKRILAERPRLRGAREAKSDSNRMSEGALLAEHSKSVASAVKQVHAGSEAGEALGPLGSVVLPPQSKRPRIMEEAAQAADEMYTRLSRPPADQPEVVDASSLLAGEEDPEGFNCVSMQKKVANRKAAMFAASKPGVPVPHVDACGRLVQVRKPVSGLGPPPALPQAPVVLPAKGLRDKVKTLQSCDGHKFLRSGTFDRVADLVLVWEFSFRGPDALYARLQGSGFVTLAWFQRCGKQEEVCFRSAMAHGKHMMLSVHATFSSEFPDHLKVLKACANHTPSMNGGRPRFEIQEGEMPTSVRTPTLTHQLVGHDRC